MLSSPASKWSLLVLLLAAGFTVRVFAEAEPSAMALLDRMSHSFRELSYQGVFSYQRGSQVESFRITHAIFDDKEYERLEHLNGEPREVVRSGHSLACMHPGHQLLRSYQQQQSASSAASPAQSRPGVDRYYQFAVAGQGRVAGREVVEIAVMPLDAYRFGYSLALDKETGLLLRSSLLGAGGEVIERFQFVEVAIGIDIPISKFASSDHSYHAGHHKPADESAPPEQSATDSAWQVNWLPVGFTITSPAQEAGSEDMRTFTDGLTVFSVFLETADIDQPAGEGRARQGATIAYSRAVQFEDQPFRVTVVGEIPYITAKKVAKSVTLAGI